MIASRAAPGEAGWSSHLVYSRMSAPWSRAVWIQSIHGRRLAASTGPVAPSTMTGMRSHQALKIAIDGVHQPDVGMHGGDHGLAGDLGVALGDGDGGFLMQAEQHLRLRIAEIIDDRVVQAAIARPGVSAI